VPRLSKTLTPQSNFIEIGEVLHILTVVIEIMQCKLVLLGLSRVVFSNRNSDLFFTVFINHTSVVKKTKAKNIVR